MLAILKEAANHHQQGLITDREFLGQVINCIGVRWADTPETSNDDKDISTLSVALDQLKW